MIKALSETKPETTKPKPKPKKNKKPEAPEELKIRIKTYKRKLRKPRKDFDELRYKFSKNEIDRYRKAFYVAKNKKYLLESELKNTIRNLNELEKSLRFKKFHGNIDTIDYEDLDNYDYNCDFADDD